jgi:hypothetical protein
MAIKDPKRQDPGFSVTPAEKGQITALPAEVKRRYEAYKSGKTTPISLEELFSDL